MRPRKNDPHLSPERIVEAAWALVSEGGFEALSSRRLASVLGVQSPALYHHVPAMQQLMGLMIEYALRDASVPTEGYDDWRAWFRDTALSHRSALLAYRDSGRIMAYSAPSVGMMTRFVPSFIGAMRSYKFSEQEAAALAGSVGSLVLGFVLNEQQDDHHRFAASLIPEDKAFEFTIDVLILGLEAKLREQALLVDTRDVPGSG